MMLGIGAAIVIATALYLLSKGNSPALVGIIVLLCVATIGGALLVPQPRLEIGPDGIVQKVLWSTRRFAWGDIGNFRISGVAMEGQRMVGFDYMTPSPSGGMLRKLNARIAGVQGVLQPGWEINAQALADLLNQARARWAAPTPAALTPELSEHTG